MLASSFDHWSAPKASAAAICSTIACVETLTVGTAILSFGPKSLIDLILGSRLISVIGCAEVATMPLTPPRVRSHSSRRLPVPVLRMSTLPASSASVCAPPPLKIDPFGGDAGNAEGSRVLLDQLVLFHDVRGHVENARLPRQRDLDFCWAEA